MTLVEVVVAMGILSVVLAGFLSVLATATRSTRPLQVEAATVAELRVAMSAIARELRSAECVVAPQANAAPSPTLTFSTHANGSGYEVTYWVTGGDLFRQVTGEAAVRMVTSALIEGGGAFEHIATPRRTIRVRLHVQTAADRPSRELSTVVAGRNAWQGC